MFILVVASFVFYGYSNISFLSLLAASAFINAITSYGVLKNKKNMKKMIAIIGVLANIFILMFFKYGSLIYLTFFEEYNVFNWITLLPLPIGISFYTFQGISLVVDTFKTRELKNSDIEDFLPYIINKVFFISFFPHSIAGPIVKAHDFLPQIKVKELKDLDIEYIFKTLTLGYFLKAVIADNLQMYSLLIEYPGFLKYSSITLCLLVFSYSIQIFADFAGYSLIAIGIAALFGYRLPDNFNYPYISSSFAEFWQRWHMSLSSWLKEYLYIPLGGNKKGKIRTYFNIMIIMLLGGLWHGAAWSYLVWGSFHGALLVLERISSNVIRMKTPLILKRIFIFVFVSWGWLLFKLPDFQHVLEYSKAMVTNMNYPLNFGISFFIIILSLPVIIYHLWYLSKKEMSYYTQILVYAIMMFFIIMNSGDSNVFIYFQF